MNSPILPKKNMNAQLSRIVFVICLIITLAGCQQSGQPQQPEVFVETLATGSFVDKGGQHTVGSYAIQWVGDDLQLFLSEDFQTDKGPDLHLVLSRTPLESADNDNVMEGAEVITPLIALSGAQTYDLPIDLDLSPYSTLLIHCIEFSHLYGAAPLVE
jgi:hypothetical protein